MLYYHIQPHPTERQALQITLRFSQAARVPALYYIPFFRPGRYHPAGFAAKINNLEFLDDNNQAIPYVRPDPHLFELPNGQRSATVRYTFQCSQFDAGGSWRSEELLYFNPVNLLLIPEGLEEQEISLEVITKPYPPLVYPPASGTLRFKNLQEAIDSPFISSQGPTKTWAFQMHQASYYIHVFGHLPLPDASLEELFMQFTQAMHALFGEFPFTRYDYLIFCTPETRYHGVEHKNCTVITLPFSEDKEKNLRDLLGIASHELFHAWNVCRIRPRALQPYRLKAPVYFDIGYVLEGFTSYYGDLMLWRGGCLSDDEFLEELNRRFLSHYNTQGRFHATLRSSSLRLWENAYTQESLESEVSIYTRGMLAAWGTDLAIRQGSGGAKSLDDVLRAMWKQFPEDSAGYEHADIQKLVYEAGGEEALNTFHALVDSTQALESLLPGLLSDSPYRLQEENGVYRVMKKEA